MAVVGNLSVLFSLIPKDWDKGLNLVNRLKTAAIAMLGVSAMRGIVSFAQKTTEAATHLNSLSQAMGMSVTQTQEWGFVAEQSGSNLKELSVGLSMFERNLSKLANGTASKLVTRNLAAIGINAAQARDAMSSPAGLQRQLLRVSDVVKNSRDTARQAPVAAAFQQNFGFRAGRAAYADLARGSEGLEALFAKRRAMGELSQKQVESLRDLGNEMKNVSGSFSMLGSQILADLAPAFIKLAQSAEKWISENRGVISGAFEAAFKGVAFVLRMVGDAIDLVVHAIRPFVQLIESARQGSLGAQFALLGIATVLTAVLLPAFVAWFVTTVTDLAIVAAGWLAVAFAAGLAMLPLLPWVLLLAAIAAGVILIIHYWDTFKAKVVPILVLVGKLLLAPFVGVAYAIYELVDHWHQFVNGVKNGLQSVGEFLAGLPIIKQIIEAVNWARGGGSIEQSSNGEIHSNSDGVFGALTNGLLSPFNQATRLANANVPADAPSNRSPTPTKNVTVGPTTVNINGVQGAAQVPGIMGQVAEENARRQAAASLGVD